jgi:thiol-disulfide isomerase/thioredoxin
MKKNLKLIAFTTLLLLVCSTGQVLAQMLIRNTPASDDEIKNAKAAVEADMDNLKAHEAYMYSMSLFNPLLKAQYRVWMEKYPADVNIPLAAGTIYANVEMPEAKEYLLKAAAMAPKNAKIWWMLAGDAFRQGQSDSLREYYRKASMADSSNVAYATAYLFDFQNDPDYSQKVFDFAKRFPTDNHGAMALYWLGKGATNINDQITYFEKLRKLYSPQKFSSSAAGMRELADIYLQIDPQKALAVTTDMGDAKEWLLRKQAAESLIKINKLEQNQNYRDAIIEINKVQLPDDSRIYDFITLKKASLQAKAGNVIIAYNMLIPRYGEWPTDQVYTALERYGNELNKNKEQIAKDVEAFRINSVVAAYPFKLGLYTSADSLSLKDLKGKVVLLTFWFPGCGPCRAEFPHFEAVINKFKSEEVAYVAINVLPEQDTYVLPLIKNAKYSFISLRGSRAFASKGYGVDGYPENFLLDKDGKIVYKDFRINGNNRRTLELMISSLLQKDPQNN